MVIETWESEKAIQDFMGSERFRQELQATGVPAPEMEIRPVHYVAVIA
jgi:quinol monooxygenase YgiN